MSLPLALVSLFLAPPPPVELTYLGTAGWEIRGGGKVVLVDPYFTRLRFGEGGLKGDPRKVYGWDDPVTSDEAALTRHAPRKADVILVAHSHWDHAMDAPALALRTGATIVGTESTTNLARASGVPDAQLATARGGEELTYGDVSIRVLPSLHSILDDKELLGGLIPADVKPPLRLRDYHEGGSLAFLVRVGGHRILFISSANFVEEALVGLQPDVAVLAVGLRERVPDYTCRLMRVLERPRLVLPTHFDGQTTPLERVGEERAELDAGLRPFLREVRGCSRRTRARVPRHFEPIRLPPAPAR